MSVSGICHYNIRAPRPLLDDLQAFYCEVVGLTLGPRPAFRSFGYWLYAGNKDVLHLTEAGDDELRDVGVTSTFDHVAFACSNPAAHQTKLRLAGIPYQSDSVPGAGQLQLFFTDPAGNGVELNFVDGI